MDLVFLTLESSSMLTALQQRSTSFHNLLRLGLHSVLHGMSHVNHTNLGTQILKVYRRTAPRSRGVSSSWHCGIFSLPSTMGPSTSPLPLQSCCIVGIRRISTDVTPHRA